MIAGSSSIFLKYIWTKTCSWAALLKFWFQTDLGRENSTGFYIQGRQSLLTFFTIVTNRDLSYCILESRVDHALRPIFMLWLVKIWQVSSCGKFMQRLETCLLIAEADRILCHLVMSLTVFFYLMFQRAANKIILCNSWLVCLLHFWLRNAPLVKVIGNPISDSIVFIIELTHLPLLEAYKEGWKVSSDSGLTWWPSGAASWLVNLSNYCLWCVFFFGFLRSSVVYAA